MILGERIRLRRNERTDISKFVGWLNDPEVHRYLSLNMPISTANEEQWFENMLKLPAPEQPFAIETRKTSPENGMLIMSVLRSEWNPGEQVKE